ncbi:MAG: DUF1573 domain-containing protein [Phycisphaerales bacterium]|nr:DUF1573 domain-containing protein [Phycisphaerales bacterium]
MRRGIRSVTTRLALLCIPLASPVLAQTAEPAAQTPQPAMKIDSVMGNIGERWIDQPIEHVFHLRNAGAADLIISRIDTPDDVAAILTPTGPIAPNAEATLRATVDAKSLRAGVFEKSLTLHSNDPRSPQTTLTLAGRVRHYLDATPSALGFGKLDGDGHRERRITITNRAEKPVSVTLDESSLDRRFHYELIETTPGRTFELYVDTKPPFDPGVFRGEVRLKTNLPNQPEMTIPVYAIMPERVEVLPRVISIAQGTGANAESSPSVYVLSVQNNGDKPVHVTGASSGDPRVHVVSRPIIEGRKYRVQVQIPADYAVPSSGADVLIKTDDAVFPVLSVTIGQSARRSVHTTPRQVATNNTPSNPTQKTTKRRRPVLETIGKAAPQYDLKTMDGFPVTNRELEGHPATILNFFAPNCPHCKKQLPKVERIRLQYEPLGVRFVNVSEKMRKDFTPDEVLSVVSSLGANSELAIDAGNVIGRRFKATGYPCLIVIDGKGVISHVVSGNKKNIVEDVSEKLNALVAAEGQG